ncbi:MAG: hypothetical protein BMS9Abin29_2272 [Gemmatimonadota bacterium]|nr:MAG: hypothetical protein BMS9Abin29_2272 [Gemmatimonadota bacterium]
MTSRSCVGIAFVLAALAMPGRMAGQSLDEFDYENLSFRGFMLESGYLWADNAENTSSLAVRLDLGYLAPGFRLVPGVSYWSSELDRAQLVGLENRLNELIVARGGAPGTIQLGTIDRRDVAVTLDGSFVWSVPFGLVSFAGAGVSAHFLDGSGADIDGTFIEDLLDSVQAGVNVHLGLEYSLRDRIRIYGSPKFEVLDDLQYFELRFGLHLLWGGLAPGERH